MKELLIVAFKDVRGTKVYDKLKSHNIKFRRRLIAMDGVVFAMAETSHQFKTFHRHESGIPILDLTMPTWEEGATLLEMAIDNNQLRITR